MTWLEGVAHAGPWAWSCLAMFLTVVGLFVYVILTTPEGPKR